MRDALESGQLDCVMGIDGKSKIAELMTKRNPELSGRMNNMLSLGFWDLRLDGSES